MPGEASGMPTRALIQFLGALPLFAPVGGHVNVPTLIPCILLLVLSGVNVAAQLQGETGDEKHLKKRGHPQFGTDPGFGKAPITTWCDKLQEQGQLKSVLLYVVYGGLNVFLACWCLLVPAGACWCDCGRARTRPPTH